MLKHLFDSGGGGDKEEKRKISDVLTHRWAERLSH